MDGIEPSVILIGLLDLLQSDFISSGLIGTSAGSVTYLLRQIISADVEG
jgi:hypothetical protein